MLDGTGSAFLAARASSLTGSPPAGTALPAGSSRAPALLPMGSCRVPTLLPTGSSGAPTPLPAGSCPVADPAPAGAPAALASPELASPEFVPPEFVPSDNEPGGLHVSWTTGVGIGEVLAAAHRSARHRAGLDLPAWGEAGSIGEGRPTGEAGAGPGADELGGEALMAATEGRGRVLPAAALGGHAIMAPGPDLAGWLACCPAAGRDDAALVNSITAWRKVTSWAQAQELAAVAELARRRGVPGARDASGEDCDRAADAGDRGPAADAGREESDPVAELEAGFAPNEVALALTLTQGGAEYWMDLAVSLSRRLPATLTALSEGTIDLSRAKLIDQFTGSLELDHARAVERRVLVRAGQQTSGQLRASLQRAVLAVDPAAAERRRKQAEARAWVALFGDHDGTASLSGRFLPAAQAAAAWARICAMAKAMEAAGAGGGMDLLRAQVFVGLLLGTLPLIPPADAGPDDPGPDDTGPGDGGLGGAGPDDDGSDDDGPDDSSDDGGPEPSAPGGGAPAGAVTGGPGLGTGSPGEWDPGVEGKGSAGRPADVTGDGLAAVLAWPPLPLPGAVPAPGCARPARASPARSQDRRGPPADPRSSDQRSPQSSRLAGRAVLCVAWRTLAGSSSEPGELSRIGPVTDGVARALALAAAADVTCEWRVIVVGRSGRALAVTKIRRTGSGARGRSGGAVPPTAGGGGHVAAVPGVVGRVTLTIPAGLLGPTVMPAAPGLAGAGELAKVLGPALRAGARALAASRAGTGPGRCTHQEASPGYQVPDSMRALVEARDQTCGFPTCRQPAWRCEQDHTVAYRLGGATCPCNLSAECSRHHHLKHLPGWRLEQPRPGILTWITPARLTHTVVPGPYPV